MMMMGNRAGLLHQSVLQPRGEGALWQRFDSCAVARGDKQNAVLSSLRQYGSHVLRQLVRLSLPVRVGMRLKRMNKSGVEQNEGFILALGTFARLIVNQYFAKVFLHFV